MEESEKFLYSEVVSYDEYLNICRDVFNINVTWFFKKKNKRLVFNTFITENNDMKINYYESIY
jgi:hypothetical protein